MKNTKWLFVSILILIVISVGCNSDDDSSVSTNPLVQTETSFNFTLASFKKQEAAISVLGRQASFTADQVMTGQLTATNTATLAMQTFDWSIYFDESTFAVQSNKTIILAPGTFDFALLLTKGDQQYAGSVAGQVISDGTFNVPMTIRPIIGNTITDVTLVASLSEFKFQYDPTKLSAASLVSPQMGIIVGGGTEVIYGINPTTGISDTWINLSAGANTIQLKLYDGSLQVGRSITAQESVIVSAGLNITMDLVALHGETTFALTEAGGDATFNFKIPAEVVDEASGLSNLQVLFQMVGDKNPLDENLLTVVSDGSGGYESSVTLTNKQFDNIAISLTFTEISSGELLGSCNQLASLNSTSQTIDCELTLRRRAVIGGHLLATVGINVFNKSGQPVAGAKVNDGFKFHGITGSGVFGTEGYLKAYFWAGDRKFGASTSKLWGGANLVLTPLAVANANITLNMPFNHGVELPNETLKLRAEHTFYFPGISPVGGVSLDTDTTTDITKISADITVNEFIATGTDSYTRFYLLYKPTGYYGNALNATVVTVELRGVENDLFFQGWGIQCLNEDCSAYDGVVPTDGDYPHGIMTSPGITHTLSIEQITGTDTFRIGVDGQYSILDVSGFVDFNPSQVHFARLKNEISKVDTTGDIGMIDTTFDNVFINDVLYDNFSNVDTTISKWQNPEF